MLTQTGTRVSVDPEQLGKQVGHCALMIHQGIWGTRQAIGARIPCAQAQKAARIKTKIMADPASA